MTTRNGFHDEPRTASTESDGARASAPPPLERLRIDIAKLAASARELEASLAGELERLDPRHRAAGRNLVHYLALRRHDLRPLQHELTALGLSSLGRSEPYALATLEAVDRALRALSGEPFERDPSSAAPTHFETADAARRERTSALLGPAPAGRSTRIMVTLAEDADARTVDALLAEGTDVVRINCAKGSVAEWRKTVERVRRAERRRGRECRVLFDLSGPNPRTLHADDAGSSEVVGRVGAGDRLWLVASRSALPKKGKHRRGVVLGCTLPSIIDDLSPGERVSYDDGKLSGVVRETAAGRACIEVTFARKRRVKVRPNKGLNFPDSTLRLPPLTPKDLSDLEFVAKNGNLVGLSFVRSAEQIEALQAELSRLSAGKLGIVLKVETTQAFQRLPRLLLTAMRSPHVGIMVARGDMAIEMGFERLAEAQEEILWLGEAAYLPVIWATQVLDVLNKTGVPSRAEVTDAAMGSRAECVMLNRGEHTLEALRFLRNVLERMESHQEKKRSMLRKLGISRLDR
jgi:pyruvate kinase